ncbi:hypothetical protein EDD96_4521 [Streptomyces sp. Ag109_G2-6]|uniref:hypothetical protein n=1 Tax=Streptomyces TaxID=1883 RepID=UPI0009A4C6A1|nr:MULTISPECIES: hypothetical protein [Streptomyces]RPF40744.1 hypothetical protein EDD96_4521 [Streptomyces sp. Ag109_G2-6]
MFHLPRFLILLVASLFCVGALTTGCGGGGASKGGSAVAEWLARYQSVFPRAKNLTETYHPGELTELGTQKRSLDELLSTAPKDPPEEVSAAIVQAQALANRMDVIRTGSTREADAAAVTNAAIIGQGSTDPTTWSQLLTDMDKAAAEVIEDVACSEAWSLLSNSQKQKNGESTESYDHVGGTLEAVQGKAESILRQHWVLPSLNTLISWAKYTQGTYAKATEIAGFLKGGHVTSEDTRAYYYYARYCLKPPG